MDEQTLDDSNALPLSPRRHAKLFPQLADVVYADWAGAALPPISLIDAHSRLLKTRLLGNPHSHHTSSTRALELANEARGAVLSHFRADPAEYDVIWTANASRAMLLLQHYLFSGGELLLTADNHNSMNGLREIARRRGAFVRYAPIRPDFTLDEQALMERLDKPRTKQQRLFGFPAKSNYSGVEHPLSWIEYAQSRGWDVVVDAASYCANEDLDLSRYKPEFVPVSFYKIFGYPTGIGCLLMKKSAHARFHKQWFTGGTILLVSVMADFYALEPPGPARFEDGTIDFQMIPAVTEGLRWIRTLSERGDHARRVARRLHDRLSAASIGDRRVELHSPRGSDIVTFSVLDHGEAVDAWLVEQAADAVGIQLRTGCFCNPGVNEKAMGYTVEEFERTYHAGASVEEFTLEALRQNSGGKPIGAVRASFGYANTLEHADAIAQWVEGYLARPPSTRGSSRLGVSP